MFEHNNAGETPIPGSYDVAIKENNVKALQWLYDHGGQEDVRTPDNEGRTPMWLAILYNHVESMQWLHDHGAKEDALTSYGDGETHMMSSSGESNVEAMQWLFEHGASEDVRKANRRGETPMWYAGSAKTMQWLYDHGAKDHVRMASIDGTTPMCAAAQENNTETMQWLFDHGASDDVRKQDNKGNTPMICACEIKAMQWLFDHGASEDVRTPTYFIAGKPGAVAHGGDTPMYLAARFDSVKLMKWLFDHGADVRTARTPHQSYDKGSTPMFVACAEGHLKAVQFLHNHGAAADINAESELLETPLFIACQEQHVDIAKWLILQGTPSTKTLTRLQRTQNNDWYNALLYENRMILYQQGLANRDVDHESFVCFATIVRTTENVSRHLDIDLVLNKIGEYVRGTKKTRLLWYKIVNLGPGEDDRDLDY